MRIKEGQRRVEFIYTDIENWQSKLEMGAKSLVAGSLREKVQAVKRLSVNRFLIETERHEVLVTSRRIAINAGEALIHNVKEKELT